MLQVPVSVQGHRPSLWAVNLSGIGKVMGAGSVCPGTSLASCWVLLHMRGRSGLASSTPLLPLQTQLPGGYHTLSCESLEVQLSPQAPGTHTFQTPRLLGRSRLQKQPGRSPFMVTGGAGEGDGPTRDISPLPGPRFPPLRTQPVSMTTQSHL